MPKTKVAHPMMGARRKRSASQPIGRMPSTRKPPEIPATKTMTPELDVEGRLDVGRQDGEPRALQVVEGDDDGQDDEGRVPGLAQALAQRDVLLARSRQEVLGEQHLRRRLAGPLTLGGLVDDQVRQVGRARGLGGTRRRDTCGRGFAQRRPDLRGRRHPHSTLTARLGPPVVPARIISSRSSSQSPVSGSWGCRSARSPLPMAYGCPGP